jgi:polar amino acid transport system substrate-binding protein
VQLRPAATALALALLLAACGGGATDDVATEADPTVSEPGAPEPPASEPPASESTASEGTEAAGGAAGTIEGVEPGSCDVDQLPLFAEGTLTVATGEPVFEPWMVDDAPTNGQGFESALVYALAEEMGFAEDQVTWVRTGFDEAIAPGEKEYDFNIQQYSITEDRDEVVDFSIGYYAVEQALVAAADSPAAEATSVADLADDRLGAAIGTTSLDYVDQVIQPEQPAQVYDDNAAAKAAFDAGQVDGLVFDLPTAFFITAVEIPDASIVGVLPRDGEAEELGLLFEEGSELRPCVDLALQALIDDGTVEALEEEWLQQGGDIPTLER